jgi:hypothetical protein
MPSLRQRSRLASLMLQRAASCFCPRCLVSTGFLPNELVVLHEGVFSSQSQEVKKCGRRFKCEMRNLTVVHSSRWGRPSASDRLPALLEVFAALRCSHWQQKGAQFAGFDRGCGPTTIYQKSQPLSVGIFFAIFFGALVRTRPVRVPFHVICKLPAYYEYHG